MSTQTVDTSSSADRPLVVNESGTAYAKYELLLPNIATQGADSVSSVNVVLQGTGFLTIPTPIYTGGGGSGIVSSANMNVKTAVNVAIGTGGYAPGNVLTVVGGTFGTPAQLTVSTTYLLFVAINSGGTLYTQNDVITLVGGTHTGNVTATVTAVDGGGAITAITFITRGSFTVNTATFTTTGGTGSGATFNAATYNPLTVTISNDGFYQELPTNPVSLTGGAGTGATYNLSYGVETVSVSNGGSDYASAPAVSFPSSSGSGATATAVIAGTDDPVVISLAFQPALVTDVYEVTAMASQAATASVANKTVDGCDVTLTPISGGTLTAGTMDALVSFIN